MLINRFIFNEQKTIWLDISLISNHTHKTKWNKLLLKMLYSAFNDSIFVIRTWATFAQRTWSLRQSTVNRSHVAWRWNTKHTCSPPWAKWMLITSNLNNVSTDVLFLKPARLLLVKAKRVNTVASVALLLSPYWNIPFSPFHYLNFF